MMGSDVKVLILGLILVVVAALGAIGYATLDSLEGAIEKKEILESAYVVEVNFIDTVMFEGEEVKKITVDLTGKGYYEFKNAISDGDSSFNLNGVVFNASNFSSYRVIEESE